MLPWRECVLRGVTPCEAPVLGEKVVPVKGLERTGRDFDPEPLDGRVFHIED